MKLAGLYSHSTQCTGTGEVKYYLFRFLLAQLLAQQEVLCLLYSLAHCGSWPQANHQRQLLTQPAPTSHRTSVIYKNTAAPSCPTGNGSPCAGQCANIPINYILGAEFSSALYTFSLLFSKHSKWRCCLISGWDSRRSPWSKDNYLYI